MRPFKYSRVKEIEKLNEYKQKKIGLSSSQWRLLTAGPGPSASGQAAATAAAGLAVAAVVAAGRAASSPSFSAPRPPAPSV